MTRALAHIDPASLAHLDQLHADAREALRDLGDAMVTDLSRHEPSRWPWWLRRHFHKTQRAARQRRALGLRP